MAVLIESVFKKQKCFLCFFLSGVFISWIKVFLVLFFFFFLSKCVFFHNDGKNYCLYSNLLQFPCSSKFFCLTLLGILAHIYIMITLVIIYHYAALNVARRLKCYRCLLGWRNIAANDIVCPLLVIEKLKSETDTETFIANDNLMKV